MLSPWKLSFGFSVWLCASVPHLMGWWLSGNRPGTRHSTFSASQIWKSRTSVWNCSLEHPAKHPEMLVSFVGLIYKYSPIQSLHLCCLVDRKIENRENNETKHQKVMYDLPSFARQNNFSGEIFPSPSCHASYSSSRKFLRTFHQIMLFIC